MLYQYSYRLGAYTPQLDPDAKAYIAAVEAADGQALEPAVRVAYDQFIRGCKTDGIWDAIKASCILAGARTLSGALVPLKGTAPTNNNFVSGDYDRETGLLGDGSTKYLNSNRNNNADPQDDFSASAYLTQSDSGLASLIFGAGANTTGATTFGAYAGSSRNRTSVFNSGALTGWTGLGGTSRSTGASYVKRLNGANSTISDASQTPLNENIAIYTSLLSGLPLLVFTDARCAFYHIGEALDLAALDSRVSTLISDIAAAIP